MHFTSSDGAAVLPANYTFVAGDAGVHSFSGGVTLKTAGSSSVTGTDTVTGTITGSQTVTVNPGSATSSPWRSRRQTAVPPRHCW